MRSKKSLSHLGLACSALGAAVVGFAGCSESSAPPSPLEGNAVAESPNASRLQLTYDQGTKRVGARLNRPLEEHEQLFLRVRRGTISRQSTCTELATNGSALQGVAQGGDLRFEGPQVDDELLDLPRRFDSEVWVTGPFTESMREELRKGTDAIVETCLVKDGQVRDEQHKTLGYVIDQARDEGDTHTSGPARRAVSAAAAQPIHSMVKYAELCVQELGEIPFFRKKSGVGEYETFDCRDFKGSDDTGPRTIDGVEGRPIPLTVEDAPKPDCDFPKPVADEDNQTKNYYCVNQCDKPQYLNKGCEPGPTVTTAKNDKGTHWVLLCRAANAPTLDGMSRTKTFRDIAMIGHNPKTGKTCFFQNNIGPANDGEHIPHPADRTDSEATWSSPKGYCTTSCHAADAFVHSPWIDGALRSNGRTIVPKMGEHPDFPISWLDAPYSVVNMDAQGWKIGQQLVSEEAAACTSCHRIAGPGGNGMMRQFSAWGTLSNPNDSYFAHMTSSYKTDFVKSHWMPSNVDGLDAQKWLTSKWKKSADHVIRCATSSSPECVFADVPRGRP